MASNESANRDDSAGLEGIPSFAPEAKPAILIIDNDQVNLPPIREVLKEYEDQYDVVVKPTLDEAQTFATINVVKLILLEATKLQSDFGAWFEEWKQKCTRPENAEAPIAIMSFKDDHKIVIRMAKQGASDYIVKPIDRPLLKQKLSLLIGNRVEKQLYSFPTVTPVDVAYQATIEEISEFGMSIRFPMKIELGDVASFYSPIFKTDQKSEVLGRCYKCDPHPENKEEFRMSFVFIGINEGTLRQVRSWIRAEYVRKKQQHD